MKCVCVKCKSGYKSCSEKVSFFIVPKNKKIIKSWQIAILRDDRKFNRGDAICEKHFKPEDILRERIPYASDGITVMRRPSAWNIFIIIIIISLQ